MQIQQWIDDGNFRISYDYSELIEELASDMLEGLTDEYIYIVRGQFSEELGACPIIDYYYSADEIDDSIIAEKARTTAVLAEMELYNRIF